MRYRIKMSLILLFCILYFFFFYKNLGNMSIKIKKLYVKIQIIPLFMTYQQTCYQIFLRILEESGFCRCVIFI